MTGTLGANPDQLRSLAQHCSAGAQSLLDISASVSAVVNNPGFWKGTDADQTRQRWNTVLRVQILSASTSLDRAKSELLEQAADQERTSSDADGAGGPGMTPAGGSERMPIPGEDGNVPGPDWLLGPDSPFRDGWDMYQLIKAFPVITESRGLSRRSTTACSKGITSASGLRRSIAAAKADLQPQPSVAAAPPAPGEAGSAR